MNHSLQTTIAEIIKELFDVEMTPELSRPEPQFGDLATNVAMQLVKQVDKKPRDIAEELVTVLRRDESVMSAEVAGPGFINLRVTDVALSHALLQPVQNISGRGQIIVIETNNPNPFKDLHIGHAYNCIVADTVANLLEASGAKVHRVSYHGDVGLHVGKSMWSILRWINGDVSKLDTIEAAERPAFMSRHYIEGSEGYDMGAENRAQIEALARESFSPADPVFRRVYDICKKWSFDYITETVAHLGSKQVEKKYLESEADALGVSTVRDNIGDVFAESDGAVVFAGEAFGLHTRVFISSRGTGLYEARDLGLMQMKQQDFHPAKSYIVTAEEQREYFKVVIKAAELALPELNGVTHNISTGTVKLSSGKMSSRSGHVLNIEWLFDQLKIALAARSAGQQGASEDTSTLIGALRYSMLRPRIGGDVIFDIESALSIEGNSGPYLQYAHARARSIIAKSERSPDLGDDVVFDVYERALALKISEFDDVLSLAIVELHPHHVCNYLYELAQTFNRFYEKARIVGDERETLRLWLVEAYADRLKRGLTLMGIPAPERL